MNEEEHLNTKSSMDGDQNTETCELDICFWDMNPKEHLWSRLKAL